MERAADWVFSHMDELQEPSASAGSSGGPSENVKNYRDGCGSEWTY